MRRQHLLRRAWIACLAGCLAAPALVGGVASADPTRELEFAQTLRRRGWLDLAEDFARRAEGDTRLGDQLRGDMAFFVAEVFKTRADSSGDPNDAEKWRKKYEAQLDYAARKYPNHPKAQYGEEQKLSALLDRARNLRADAEGSPDESVRSARRTEASQIFEECVKGFDKLVGKINGLVAADEGNNELRFKRCFVVLLAATARFDYALLLGTESRRGKELFEQTLAICERFDTEYADYWNFLFQAYLLRGRVLVELGRFSDAYDIFGGLVEAEPWGWPEEAEARRNIEAVIRNIRLEAHYRNTEMLIKWGEASTGADRKEKYEAAVLGAERMLEIDPEAANEHFGRLAILALTRAYALAGRPARGMTVANTIIEKGREAPKKLTGTDTDIYGYTACKTMSEVDEEMQKAGPAAAFQARIHLAIGQGYFYRERPEEAVRHFRWALAACISEQEWRDTGVKTLFEMGAVLGTLGRWEEASIAFEAVYRHFPDHPRRTAAATATMGAAKEVKDRTSFQRRFYETARDAVSRFASEGGGGLTASRIKFQNGQEARNRKRWEEAADEFAAIFPKVEDQEVPFYWLARALEGDCWVNAGLDAKKEGTDLCARGIATLTEAREGARAADDAKGWAAAAYYLGSAHLALEQAAVANQVLADFEGGLSDWRDYAPAALYTGVRAAIAAADPDAGERRYGLLAEKYPDDQACLYAALDLTQGLDALADGAGSAEEAARLRGAAARYADEWLNKKADATSANRFWVGSLILKAGDARGLNRAQEIFESLTNDLKAQGSLSDDDRGLLDGVQVKLAEVLVMQRRWPQAIDVYRDLNKRFQGNEEVLTNLGLALLEQYKATGQRDEHLLSSDETGKRGALPVHEELFLILKSVVADAEGGGDAKALARAQLAYWVCRHRILEIYYLQKRFCDVKGTVNTWTMLGEFKDFPFPELKNKIDALLAECARRCP